MSEPSAKPDLTGRIARCSYYGSRANKKPYSGCDACAARGTCACSRPSAESLAFFRYHGPGSNVPKGLRLDRFENGKYDEFYCGCFGWD